MAHSTASSKTGAQIRVDHQYDLDTPPSIAIVEAIAVIEDIAPMDFQTDLGIRLYDQTDPEALDRLVTDNSGVAMVTVELTFHNEQQYVVKIHDSGQLVVQKLPDSI